MNIVKIILVMLLLLAAAIAFLEKPAPGISQSEPPEPAPLAKVDFPTYAKRILENGLTVYALEHHEQPVVAIRLLIGAGAANDPEGLPGLASFTADLLRQGTKTRTATEIAQAIDQVGGSLEVSADMEGTIVHTGVLRDNTGLAFELMTDIVMNPAFAPEEIARLKQQALSNLTASMQDPDFLADSVFQRAVYGIHPYGRPSDGTLRSIPAIQREDIVKFQQAHYAPNGSALVIAGDLSTDQAFKLAEQWLGSWQRKEMPKLDLNRIPKLEQRRIVAVNKPDSVQTEIRVGHPTVPRNDPDYFKVLVANYVLGGSPSGRLNQKLRAEKGLTYGAYTMIVPRKGPGSFHSITETRTEKTTEALELIFDEIRKMRSNPVPTDELRNAKDFLIGSFPLSIEVPNDLASRLTTVFLYNLGDDYLKTYRDRIAAVSADDVLQAAKEKISAENTVVVLVGKIDEFKSQLQALGKVQIIPLDKLDLGSPTLN